MLSINRNYCDNNYTYLYLEKRVKITPTLSTICIFYGRCAPGNHDVQIFDKKDFKWKICKDPDLKTSLLTNSYIDCIEAFNSYLVKLQKKQA